jgi:hypothetical protein
MPVEVRSASLADEGEVFRLLAQLLGERANLERARATFRELTNSDRARCLSLLKATCFSA